MPLQRADVPHISRLERLHITLSRYLGKCRQPTYERYSQTQTTHCCKGRGSPTKATAPERDAQKTRTEIGRRAFSRQSRCNCVRFGACTTPCSNRDSDHQPVWRARMHAHTSEPPGSGRPFIITAGRRNVVSERVHNLHD